MANRYWVGGGSSENWNATGNTNWGTASGTQDNASVPTSADDVIFDGAGTAGNSNSTISATITVKSLTITTGYTSTITHNAILTIAGNWTYVNTYTIAGTSGITLSATSTITSNGVTWPNALTLTNTTTYTLSGNLTVSGLLTVSGTSTVNRTTSETLTTSGGLTTNANISGSAKLILTGGTWSSGVNTNSCSVDLQGNVTISGNIYYGSGTLTYVSGTITTTGTTLNIQFNPTLNTSGITWNNLTFFTSGTTTLTSNLSLSGLLTISSITTINKTASETITVSNGLTINAQLNGSAKIIFKGGTWSGGVSAIRMNLDIDGNVTISGNVYYEIGTLKYVSGTTTTTNSTFNTFGPTVTLDTNGITWNDFKINGGNTITLSSDLSISGLLNISGITTVNKTANEKVTIAGGITVNAAILGTAKIILTGGIWSGGVAAIRTDLDLNGNCTISSNVYYEVGTMTYVSGTITVTSSTLNIQSSCTLNVSSVIWNNIKINLISTITLTSNLSLSGLLTVSAATTVNKTTSETVTSAGGLTVNAALSGTAKVILTAGTWSGTNTTGISNDLDLIGNSIISSNVYYRTGTLTYLSGKIDSKNGTLNITANANINGFNKCPLRAVVITGGQTVTMDRFFTGTPQQLCNVSSTGANYNIAFTDSFERMGKYVNVTGCTLARPLQLLIFTNGNRNFARSNVGIRYVNSSPNSVARNRPPIDGMFTGTAGLMQADPCFQK